MSHLLFPHTEYLTQQKEAAAPKLLMENGSWPRPTLGSCKGIVWEAANSHSTGECAAGLAIWKVLHELLCFGPALAVLQLW